MMSKKVKVAKILKELEYMNPDEVSKKDGKLDFEKLGKRKEVKKAIRELNKLNVNRKYLMKHFFIAGFIIGHLLKGGKKNGN